MPRAAAVLLIALATLASAGCVERRIIFRTPDEMPPVMIELDGEPIGMTPVEVSFHRYGTREFVARAKGFQPHEDRIHLPVPWYQYPVIDLVTEGLVPFKIRDDHVVLITLDPIEERDSDELYRRARRFYMESEKELAEARARLDRDPAREGGGAPNPHKEQE